MTTAVPPWELQVGTYNYDTRMQHADTAADNAWPFRTLGYEILPVVPRDIALDLGRWFKSLPTKDEGTLGFYETETILSSELAREIITGIGVWMRAGMWLGAPPVLIDIAAWVSRPNTGDPEGAQVWHRDMDDWRAVKLFIYLTDVGVNDGPHQYVAGSHRPEWFLERGLAPDNWFVSSGRGVAGLDEAVDEFPRKEFCGPAGTVWLENTYGFHRGVPPTSGERILLQATFVVSEYVGMETKRVSIKERWGI